GSAGSAAPERDTSVRGSASATVPRRGRRCRSPLGCIADASWMRRTPPRLFGRARLTSFIGALGLAWMRRRPRRRIARRERLLDGFVDGALARVDAAPPVERGNGRNFELG